MVGIRTKSRSNSTSKPHSIPPFKTSGFFHQRRQSLCRELIVASLSGIINRVDVGASKVCGTLEIKGLTPELDSLVTFFEGEIVGEVGSPGFRTGRFGATEFDDLKHWRRFPAFTRNRLERSLIKPELNLRTAKNKPYVFLRLKERFVVNHRIEAIHGASYAGFYYCCEYTLQVAQLQLVHKIEY